MLKRPHQPSHESLPDHNHLLQAQDVGNPVLHPSGPMTWGNDQLIKDHNARGGGGKIETPTYTCPHSLL